MNGPLRVAVIGAGPMGLAAAWELAKRGCAVTLYERDDRLGGMSASIDFDGTRIERYYHFICKPDRQTFEALEEFGLSGRLRWVPTHMGFFHDGRLHDWGTPWALLRFPGLGLAHKLRYALHVLRAKSIRDWRPYDRLEATQWLRDWLGPRAYEVLWHPLFHYKFYEYERSLSAAWLGTRIQRVARSRRSVFQEELGYLEGGSEVLLEAMAQRLRAAGARIELGAGIREILVQGEGAQRRVTGVARSGAADAEPFDRVVSTVPLPYVARLVPAFTAAERARIESIRNVGVVCVLLKLRRPFTRNFWMNINSPGIEIPGLIEYTNLNPVAGAGGPAILYAPYYMPQTHPKYAREPAQFIEETLGYLERIRPDFRRDEVLAATASRYEFAQTVCTPGFYDRLPPLRSDIAGLFAADTSHYYPEDRSISESLRVGIELAGLAAA